MKIFTVLNDSDILDEPWVANFLTEREAIAYIEELNREYWARSDGFKPIPKPEEHYNGRRYDFTGGYCTEWCYLFETGEE